MSRPRNIAVVTVEWSDDYRGGDLSGHFGGEGNEKYIFKPFRGVFYGYFPPNGVNFAVPKPGIEWLIFFVSRPAQNAPSVIVGWFENAEIVGDRPRPDAARLGQNSEGGPFSYSAIAPRAISIPVAARDCILPKGDSLRSFAFVRIDGVNKPSRSKLIKTLIAYRKRVNDVETRATSNGGGGFPIDPKLKTRIEKAAVRAVKAEYRNGFRFRDMQEVRGAGYDLEFTDKRSGEIWCIEVKGTAGAREAFFITRAERNAGKEILVKERSSGLRRWRLALVTRALDVAQRRIDYFKADELDKLFDFQCLQWQAVSKLKAKQ